MKNPRAIYNTDILDLDTKGKKQIHEQWIIYIDIHHGNRIKEGHLHKSKCKWFTDQWEGFCHYAVFEPISYIYTRLYISKPIHIISA